MKRPISIIAFLGSSAYVAELNLFDYLCRDHPQALWRHSGSRFGFLAQVVGAAVHFEMRQQVVRADWQTGSLDEARERHTAAMLAGADMVIFCLPYGDARRDALTKLVRGLRVEQQHWAALDPLWTAEAASGMLRRQRSRWVGPHGYEERIDFVESRPCPIRGLG